MKVHAVFSYSRCRHAPAQAQRSTAENPVMNDMNCLPAMGSHAQLAQWIESNETLLSSVLLTRPQGGARMRGLFVSRSDTDDCLLRLCEGADDAWMIWIDQRRARSQFGEAYADALAAAWLERMEADGWRVAWSARRSAQAMPIAA